MTTTVTGRFDNVPTAPLSNSPSTQEVVNALAKGEETLIETGKLEDIKEEEKVEGAETPALDKDKLEEEIDKELDAKPVTEELEEEKPEEAPIEVKGLRSGSLSKLKAKYPNILKEFPWVKDLAYQSDEMAKVFPSIESAQEAKATIEIMRGFEASVMDGDPGVLLQSLDKESKPAFKKFVQNFVRTALSVDESSTTQYLVGPVINTVLRKVLNVGRQSGNKNLELAALHIANWIHGKPEIPNDPGEVEDPDVKVRQKENEIYSKTSRAFRSEVINDTNEQLGEMIERSLGNVKLKPLVKKAAVSEIFDGVMKVLASDDGHRANMDSLFQLAYRDIPNGTHAQFKSRISSALLDRAKALIPGLRTKVLNDILDNEPQASEPRQPRGSVPSGKTTQLPDKKKLRNMSSLDILKIGSEEN